MKNGRITLREAARFHGHLGPYLVLGVLAGELAVKRLKAKKHFGLKVDVRGAHKKPKSCLIDGLQLSTGATYGKGNIRKIEGSRILISLRSTVNNCRAVLSVKSKVLNRLASLKGHSDSEAFARQLYRTDTSEIFNLSFKKGS